MTSTVTIAMLACLASIVAAPTNVHSKQDISLPFKDRAAIKLGQSIYKDNCASCHGVNLEGQIGWQTEIVDGRRLSLFLLPSSFFLLPSPFPLPPFFLLPLA